MGHVTCKSTNRRLFQSSFDRFLIKLLQFGQRHLPGCTFDVVSLQCAYFKEYQSRTSPELNHREDVRSTMELRLNGFLRVATSMICRSVGSASQAATRFAIGAADGRNIFRVLSIQARICHRQKEYIKSRRRGQHSRVGNNDSVASRSKSTAIGIFESLLESPCCLPLCKSGSFFQARNEKRRLCVSSESRDDS